MVLTYAFINTILGSLIGLSDSHSGKTTEQGILLWPQGKQGEQSVAIQSCGYPHTLSIIRRKQKDL